MPDLLTYLWPVVNGGGIVAFAVLGILGFARGWWVPGIIYRQEQARAEKLADQVDQFATAMERLTDEVRDGNRGRGRA